MPAKINRRLFLQIGLLSLAGLALPVQAAGAAALEPQGPARHLAQPAPLFNAHPTQPALALTFDDGLINVARCLDLLRAAHVRLTFFPVGAVIERHPDLWQQAVADGHEIGCHSYSHPPLGGQPYGVVADELDRFLVAAQTHLGSVPIRYFRPPYGSGWNDAALKAAAAERGMQVVMWNRVNTMNDAAQPTWREVLAGFRRQARSGDIFLYHFRYQEVEALPAIFELCDRWGWQVGTLSQLLSA